MIEFMFASQFCWWSTFHFIFTVIFITCAYCLYLFIYSLALHSGTCFASHWRVRRKVSTASSCQPLDWKQIASAHCFEPSDAERSPRKACWANCEARTISLVDENLTGWDHRWILLKADKITDEMSDDKQAKQNAKVKFLAEATNAIFSIII